MDLHCRQTVVRNSRSQVSGSKALTARMHHHHNDSLARFRPPGYRLPATVDCFLNLPLSFFLYRQLLASFVEKTQISQRWEVRTIWAVATQQAPAENLDKPAPRHPVSEGSRRRFHPVFIQNRVRRWLSPSKLSVLFHFSRSPFTHIRSHAIIIIIQPSLNPV